MCFSPTADFRKMLARTAEGAEFPFPVHPHMPMPWRLGQALNHVVGFMNLTALDRRMPAKGRADHLAQHLGAVDDEQPADLRVEPAFDQIVDERLHDGGILGRTFDQAERVLIAEEAL
jgi:hypothetical protein